MTSRSAAAGSAIHEGPFPHVLQRASTLPIEVSSPRASRSHLAPEDAFYTASPPRRASGHEINMNNDSGPEMSSRLHLPKLDSRSRSRRRRRSWKKLLWVKQSYPDNYTDQATFLENLQRNPRLQPYDFWPLVADSTVVVQQLCSVIIFVTCFIGIFQERVSPGAVVGWGSFATFIGWLLWDWWLRQEDEDEDENAQLRSARTRRAGRPRDKSAPPAMAAPRGSSTNQYGDRRTSQGNLSVIRQPHAASATSLQSSASHNSNSDTRAIPERQNSHKHRPSSPLRRGRLSLRLGTIKSAALIYFTLLGLSPILKSLTRSTSSDSIWSMSFWLLTINVFFFDYSGGVGVKFPASLSTNAALMASTVLASRLPSTGQVFSLTLFSIEVFGLFPVFRRYARHRSWWYHVAITAMLVLGAGGGAGMILGDDRNGIPWKSGLAGVIVGAFMAAVAMGGCAWWLIGLQKYKNAINGPWDQARPIIISRPRWDDD